MEEFKIGWEIFQKYGWPGIIVAVFMWDKIIRPAYRKWTGQFVGYKDLEKKLDLNNSTIAELKLEISQACDLVSSHKVDAVQNNARLDTLEVAHRRLDSDLNEMRFIARDIATHLKANNFIMGKIKDYFERIEGK